MKKLLVTSLLILAAFGAQAQTKDSGFYAGASFGIASMANVTDNVGTKLGCTSSTCSEKSTESVTRLTAGYSINNDWAAELNYGNMGAYSQTTTSSKGEIKVSGIDLVALYKWKPAGDSWVLLPKFGLTSNSGKTTFSSTGNSYTKSNTGLALGFGAAYKITPDLALRLDWDSRSFQSGGSGSTYYKGGASIFSVGATYNF